VAIDIVVQSLLRVELFAGLKPLQVAELARRSDRIVYKPGDMIITEGAAGDAAVLIIKGDAARISGPSMMELAEPIPDGSLLGEMAMLIETTHSSTVIARAMTRAIRITRDGVLEQIASDNSLADHLSQKLARRLDAMSRQLRAIDETFALLDEPGFAFPANTGIAPMGHAAQLH
jgi:CRP/FNR family transcriptional regulator, cyclic AMP receptor protein